MVLSPSPSPSLSLGIRMTVLLPVLGRLGGLGLVDMLVRLLGLWRVFGFGRREEVVIGGF